MALSTSNHVYFDTSVLLAILQIERTATEANQIWENAAMRFSSVLLKAEGLIALRRSPAGKVRLVPDLKSQSETALKRMLYQTYLIPVDEPVLNAIEREPRLARCRSQDALHLATAQYIQIETGEPLVICTYDTRMRETARDLGFKVLPVEP